MKKEGDESINIHEKENNKEEIKSQDTILKDLNESYSKYIIDDISSNFLSQSFNDDIETKITKKIDLRKKGRNINNFNDNEDTKLQKEDKKEEEKEKNNIKEKNDNKNINKKEEENIKGDELKDKSINILKKTSFLDEGKKQKISSKKKKLELLKKKEENYLNLINFQSELRHKEIKRLEDQINRQSNNNNIINKDLVASDTDSNIEYGLDPNKKIENGVAFLSHLFEIHIEFSKLDFLQNLINVNQKLKKSRAKKRTYTCKINTKIDINVLNANKKRKKSTLVAMKGMDKIQQKLEKRKNLRFSFASNLQTIEENKKLVIQDESNEINEENELNEIKEEEESSRLRNNNFGDTFIQMERFGDIIQPIDKRQLIEYDFFYK